MQGRLTLTRNRTRCIKYNYGWELFFFTLDSPFTEVGPVALWGARSAAKQARFFTIFWDQTACAFMANVAGRLRDVVDGIPWHVWRSGSFALPLGFLAAKNFTPLRVA